MNQKYSMEFGPDVVLGKNVRVDANVLIGYPPSRKVEDQKTVIGENSYIRSGTIIYASTKIGASFESGHYVVVREENQIGDHVSVWNHSIIDYGCKIGNNIKIHNRVYLAQFTTIDDNVFVGPGVLTTNDKYIVLKNFPGPHIHQGVKVGAGSILLPGIHIGENSLIGSGSIVTKNIPEGVVAYGHPAQVQGTLKDFEHKTKEILGLSE